MGESLYLIDGHWQIYRAYYARIPDLVAPTGEPTRAVMVFTQMLLKLLRERRPDYVALVLDTSDETVFRREIHPDYKAHRPPPPEDLPRQTERILQIARAMGLPILQVPGFEADDIIATLVRRLTGRRPGAPEGERRATAGEDVARAAKPADRTGQQGTPTDQAGARTGDAGDRTGDATAWSGDTAARSGEDAAPTADAGAPATARDIDIFIVSRDKDLDPLLGPHVAMYDPMSDEVITAEDLPKRKGFTPAQAADVLALTGDTSDNIPGVPGVGPKTAARLIQQYGSLENLLAHTHKLKGKLRERIESSREAVLLARRLVELRDDVPLEFDLAEARADRLDLSRCEPIFRELGFTRLLDQIAREQPVPAESAPAVRLRAEAPRYEAVDSEPAFAALVEQLARRRRFAFDTETTALNPVAGEIVGMSFSWEAGRACYIPLRSTLGRTLPLEPVVERLRPILEDPQIGKCGQNLKYDAVVLRNLGIRLRGIEFDTMIAAYLLDPEQRAYSLDFLAKSLLGIETTPIKDLIGRGKKQKTLAEVDPLAVCQYAAEDADIAWRLTEVLEERLAGSPLEPLFRETELPLIDVLAEMEFNGVALDVAHLRRMGEELGRRLEEIRGRIYEAAGEKFNIDSHRQLASVLFDKDKLGLRVVRKTKTARSTDAETLATLARETGHPVLALLQEYRELSKLKSTYIDALPNYVCARTGRVHTSFHQTGTATGRLSSSDPNLQNIPVRTPVGREIRRAFIARDAAHRLLSADYSQIELRILAHLSGDETLQQAFREDQDIHRFVAAQIAGLRPEDVTEEMRSRAKAVNFGIIYGQSAYGLSRTTDLSLSEARAFIAEYFRRYPRIREFIDRCIAEARERGYATTLLGRRRPIRHLDSRSPAVRAQAERLAVNTVVQGTAADLIKRAMIAIHERILSGALPARLILQVHDELVFEVPAEAAEEVGRQVAEQMRGALSLAVPLKVDVGIGPNWLECK